MSKRNSDSSAVKVPLVDLKAQYNALKIEIDTAIHQILDAAYYIEGPFVAEFERNFATYIGTSEAVALDSGTAALQLGLQALDLKPGDEVIVPTNTFIATAAAADVIGIRCRFVDSRADHWQMDVGTIEAAITRKTKAVICVHLYGQPIQLDELQGLCRRRNLILIEDAAQAHGAKYKGQRVGTFGAFAAFSCYPAKNLGAFGDAGVLTTNDQELAERVRRLRNHGRHTKYEHSEVGYNYRMDAIQGAVLNCKLRSLDSWNHKRRVWALRYRKQLAGLPVRLPAPILDTDPVHHLFTIQCSLRDDLASHLSSRNIETGVHYPVPLHLQPAFGHLGYKNGDFPVAEQIAQQTLSLPIFAEMTEGQFGRICHGIDEFFTANAKAALETQAVRG